MSRMSCFVSGLLLLALLLPACQPVMPVETAATAAAAPSALEEALEGKYAGTTVTMQGVWPEGWVFEGTLAPFEEQTGIKVDYTWWEDELNPELHAALEDGTGPDVVEFTNPFAMMDLARHGKVIDVRTFLPMETLHERYEPFWLQTAMVPGPDGPIMGGLFTQFFPKSMVWYPKGGLRSRRLPSPHNLGRADRPF